MKRNRTHKVQQPKKKNDMTIRISSDELMRMDRAARRQAQIESGTYVKGGVHGGDKHQRNKRDRRDARQQTRRFDAGAGE